MKLDNKGCIIRSWQNNYPRPGGIFTLSIQTDRCLEEQITFQMPTHPSDPRLGSSCVEAVIVPENPFGEIFAMDIENLGKPENISVFRMDVFTGQQEKILASTKFNTGEKRRITYDSSKWQSGTHLIHVYYGDILIADQVIKQ